MIKFLGLSHNGEKKIDPRLAWFMLHNIYCMYSDIKNKKESYAAVIIIIMSEHK